MIRKKITSLYHGQAGVHEKYVYQAIKAETDLQLEFQGEKMIVDLEKLKQSTPAKNKFSDKRTGIPYQLYYFRWRMPEPEVKSKPKEKVVTQGSLL